VISLYLNLSVFICENLWLNSYDMQKEKLGIKSQTLSKENRK